VRTSKLVAVLAAVAAAACSQYDDGHDPVVTSTVPQPVTRVVTGSDTMAGAVGVVHVAETDVMPPPSTGPIANVSSPLAVIPGGAALFEITSDTAFDTIYVGAAGKYGYWEIPVASGTAQSVVVTIPQEARSSVTLRFALASGGVVGEWVSVRVTVLRVGTGAVQVSLTFDTRADVDLYLVEPGGEEIYYGHKISAAGGRLDLDANAACSTSSIFNENITYETGSPPRGTYQVRVNYYDECSVPQPTRYVVAVVVEGSVSTYFGTLDPPGVGGGAGAGIPVATFVY